MASAAKSVTRMVSKAEQAHIEQGKLEGFKVADNRKPAKLVKVKEDTTSVLGQIKFCLKSENRAPMIVASMFGAFIPVSAYWLVHSEIPAEFLKASTSGYIWASVKILIVLGCMVFSALSVNQWGKRVFKDARKALGFTVALELIMVASSTIALAGFALFLAVIVNVVTVNVNLIMGRKGSEEI